MLLHLLLNFLLGQTVFLYWEAKTFFFRATQNPFWVLRILCSLSVPVENDLVTGAGKNKSKVSFSPNCQLSKMNTSGSEFPRRIYSLKWEKLTDKKNSTLTMTATNPIFRKGERKMRFFFSLEEILARERSAGFRLFYYDDDDDEENPSWCLI